MGRIYAKAQREKLNQNLNEILGMLNDLKGEDFQTGKEKILTRLEEMIAEAEKRSSESEEIGDGWDFSKEKAEPLFAGDDYICLRPFSMGDERFYSLIREQYKIFDKELPEEQLIASYWSETQKKSVFFCVIERTGDHAKLGYIALKNTSKDLWEIAIELDREHCYQGYGTKAIKLFLQKIKEITGRSQFQFLVEVDNIPCQNCMKKVKARLSGIHNLAFNNNQDAEAFEQNNLELITAHMKTLAKDLRVAPKRLLSHVLDYRLDV